MKKPIDFGKFVFFFAAIFLSAAVSQFAQETQPFSVNTSPLPPANGFVNDFAGVIDAATKQQIEAKLKNLKETTNPQVEIAVAVIKTTDGRDISEFALAVYRGWKIGMQEGDNPGALLLVAIDDRKYFTEVGRDLEDELPDGLVGSLQRQYLVPEFKKGNYGKGISDTIDAYIAAIRNKGNIAAPQKPVAGTGSSASGSTFGFFCCAVVVLIILLIVFTRGKGGPSGKDRNRWGGGGFGGSGGGDVLSGVIGGIIGSSLSGGSSSSSDWGSSDSGGGGWGGFGGGGDAGGGGAGGGW